VVLPRITEPSARSPPNKEWSSCGRPRPGRAPRQSWHCGPKCHELSLMKSGMPCSGPPRALRFALLVQCFGDVQRHRGGVVSIRVQSRTCMSNRIDGARYLSAREQARLFNPTSALPEDRQWFIPPPACFLHVHPFAMFPFFFFILFFSNGRPCQPLCHSLPRSNQPFGKTATTTRPVWRTCGRRSE